MVPGPLSEPRTTHPAKRDKIGGKILVPIDEYEKNLTVLVKRLKARGYRPRVVSAPSLDLFDRQSSEYRDKVLGPDRSRIVAIEVEPKALLKL